MHDLQAGVLHWEWGVRLKREVMTTVHIIPHA